jgi:signal peptidase I
MLVVGDSMLPTLQDGTLIISVSESGYNVGDVVAFTPPRGAGAAPMVIHRLVDGSPGDGYVTRGDNNESADPWTVSPELIIGRQVLAVPGAAAWLSALKSPLVVAALTALLATYALSGVLFPARRPAQTSPHSA